MNPISILAIMAGLYFIITRKDAAAAAEVQAVDEKTSSDPMVADVITLQKLLNPSGVKWLVRFDELNASDMAAAREILRKYQGSKFNNFQKTFNAKFQTNLTELFTQKVFMSAADLAWFTSIINGTESATNKAKDTKTVSVPVGVHVLVQKDTIMYSADPTGRKPNFNAKIPYPKGTLTSTLKTTGYFYETGIMIKEIYVQVKNGSGSINAFFNIQDIGYKA